jgi:hypothetical protein
MKAKTGRLLSILPLALGIAVVSGCGGDETAPTEDHTPTTYNVLFNEIPVTSPYVFTVGQTVRVRLKLFNAAGDDLDDVEAEHFAGLTFDPSDLVTVARVPGHNYQFDVTGANAGTGTLVVGFGHDEQADETAFPSAPVTVEASGGAN